jgi:predicted Fe-Mo cluster-binding NifX family protein
MKAAFAVWSGRISPVFDVSRRLVVLEVHNGEAVARTEETIEGEHPVGKVRRLVQLGIETLVCGAISAHLADLARQQGIRMIPFTAGEVEEVIQAYLLGTLPKRELTMPGCCGRRSRFRGRL